MKSFTQQLGLAMTLFVGCTSTPTLENEPANETEQILPVSFETSDGKRYHGEGVITFFSAGGEGTNFAEVRFNGFEPYMSTVDPLVLAESQFDDLISGKQVNLIPVELQQPSFLEGMAPVPPEFGFPPNYGAPVGYGIMTQTADGLLAFDDFVYRHAISIQLTLVPGKRVRLSVTFGPGMSISGSIVNSESATATIEGDMQITCAYGLPTIHFDSLFNKNAFCIDIWNRNGGLQEFSSAFAAR